MKETFDKYINKSARIMLGGLDIEVRIVDIKTSYGKPRFRVVPISGNGMIWVENVFGLDEVKK